MAFALTRGFSRATSPTCNFLGRYDAGDALIFCCRWRSSSPSAGRARRAATLTGALERRRWKGPSRSFHAVRSRAGSHQGTWHHGGGLLQRQCRRIRSKTQRFSNMLEIWAILVVPFATAFALRPVRVGDERQGRAIVVAMSIGLGRHPRRLLGGGGGQSLLTSLRRSDRRQYGGKETRFASR